MLEQTIFLEILSFGEHIWVIYRLLNHPIYGATEAADRVTFKIKNQIIHRLTTTTHHDKVAINIRRLMIVIRQRIRIAMWIWMTLNMVGNRVGDNRVVMIHI
jgi:hypothetical protein